MTDVEQLILSLSLIVSVYNFFMLLNISNKIDKKQDCEQNRTTTK